MLTSQMCVRVTTRVQVGYETSWISSFLFLIHQFFPFYEEDLKQMVFSGILSTKLTCRQSAGSSVCSAVLLPPKGTRSNPQVPEGLALGWRGGGGRGDKGYRIHMTCYTLGSRWMHDSLRANPLAGYREKFLFLCPSLLHRSLSSYLFTRFDLHSKWRSSTFFQFSNYC